MTTTTEIIQAAFREANYIGQGETPETAEQATALLKLQAMADSLMGSTVGLKPTPWYIPTPFNTAPEARRAPAIYSGDVNRNASRDLAYPSIQSRVILRNTSAQTIYFQYQPPDGAWMSIVDAGFTADVTLDANGMFFESDGNTRTLTIEPRTTGRNPTRDYIFREDTASWNQVNALTLTAEFPFPTIFDDYWITGLALRLSPTFGAKQLEVTALRFKEMTSFIKTWYQQTQEVLIGDAGTPTEQSYNNAGFGNDSSFNVGGGY